MIASLTKEDKFYPEPLNHVVTTYILEVHPERKVAAFE
jgi:hypothetical protein